MKKLVSLLVVFSLVGCSATNAPIDDKESPNTYAFRQNELEKTVSTVWTATEKSDWKTVYKYLDPNVQVFIPMSSYVAVESACSADLTNRTYKASLVSVSHINTSEGFVTMVGTEGKNSITVKQDWLYQGNKWTWQITQEARNLYLSYSIKAHIKYLEEQGQCT